MDILVARLTKANDAYRNGLALLMTDDEYDAGLEALAKHSPNHPLLKKVRAAPVKLAGKTVVMPYYLGSLDKAKVPEDLTKWVTKTKTVGGATTYLISEKLDGISGLWNPTKGKLYLSGDDNTGLDVSAWLAHLSLTPPSKKLATDIPEDVWIRGELIMPRSSVPSGRLGRSIVNGIFHHHNPDPAEAAKVRFVAYEVIGMDTTLTMKQQFAWLDLWCTWLPWSLYTKDIPSPDGLTKLLADRRTASEYDMDGLVIRTNAVATPRITKGNPKDAIAWKPPNGETRLTKVVKVEWNASSVGRLIPRIEIEPVQLGGSTITFVTGVNARRVVDWQLGPGATVVIRKGGDVIPVIDSVEIPATVVFPPNGTWSWEGKPEDATHIKQVAADNTTIAAQYMKMAQRLGWENIGPAQMKAVVDAGYTTVTLLRAVSEEALKKLLGPIKGSHLYKTIQTDGWAKATELDLFVASPLCPSGIGKTRLEALQVSEPNILKWSLEGLIAPKGWSLDALKEFQVVWRDYEKFRKDSWSFLAYPYRPAAEATHVAEAVQLAQAIHEKKGTVVFTGFRDAALEANLAAKGYKLSDTVKSDTKAVFIADKEDPLTYTSTKIDKAKKIPGCIILRRADWQRL